MSDIVGEHIEKAVTEVDKIVSSLNAQTIAVNTSTNEVMVEITKITFNQIFENFLNQSEEQLNKFSIKLSSEMKRETRIF